MPHPAPAQVFGLSNVVALAAGDNHSLALKSDGSVWAWGFDGNLIGSSVPRPISGLSNVVALAAGDNHSLALESDGSVWAWGYKSPGELVSGGVAQVGGLSNVVAIAAGDAHNLALEADGSVWAWGDNGSGQLGVPTTQTCGFAFTYPCSSVPVPVRGLSNVVAIAAGGNHSLALEADGSMWAWGDNSAGQLGCGSSDDMAHPTPARVSCLSNVTAIAAGDAHSLALEADGTLWSWGDNAEGQLGRGSSDNVPHPTPAQVSALGNVVAIAAGGNHSLAVGADGALWSWGDNYDGEVGTGTAGGGGCSCVPAPARVPGLSNGLAVAGGGRHSLTLTAPAGPLAGLAPRALPDFGNQQVGTRSAVQTLTVSNLGLAPLVVGGVALGGANPGDFAAPSTCAGVSLYPGQTCTIYVTFSPTGLGSRAASLTITDNAPDSPQTLALSGSGVNPQASLSASSLDFGAQPLGTTSVTQTVMVTNTGTTTLTVATVAISGANAADFAEADTCAGAALAPGGTCGIAVSFTPTGPGTRRAQVALTYSAAGSPQSVGVSVGVQGVGTGPAAGLSAGALLFGQQPLGTPSLTRTLTLTNTGTGALTLTAVTLSGPAAADFQVADGCTGQTLAPDGMCQIAVGFVPGGLGTRLARLQVSDNAADSPQAVALAGIGTPAGAVTPVGAGTVWSWGANGFGQLGLGSADASPHAAARPIGGLSNVVAIAAGATHGLALTADGTMWAWGNDRYDQLGTRHIGEQYSNVDFVPHPDPLPVLGPGNVVAIAAGSLHSLALRSDGTVWAWGKDDVGQLGTVYTTTAAVNPETDNVPTQVDNGVGNVVAIAAGASHSLALEADGSVWAWGYNESGQLGTPTTQGCLFVTDAPCSWVAVQVQGLSNVVAIAAGGNHNLALEADGTVWAWGDNTSGELGSGGSDDAPHPTPVRVSALANVVAIAAGGNHSLALEADGSVWAWGDNGVGQLGLGSSDGAPHPTPARIGALANIAAIAAGAYDSLAVGADGTVWAWGANADGEAGSGAAAGGACSCVPAPAPVPGLVHALAVAGGGAHSLALTAPADPSALLSQDSLFFGPQPTGVTSSAQTVVLTNTGTTALTVSGVTIGGADAGDFGEADTCSGVSLAPGSACSIQLSFTPGAPGDRTARLSIADNAVDSPQIVLLSGRGGSAFLRGDVFVVSGELQHYDASGHLVAATVPQGSGGRMCFDAAGNLYVTGPNVSKFNSQGALLTTNWSHNPPSPEAESCVVDAGGHVYVASGNGGAGPFGDPAHATQDLYEYDASGNLLATFILDDGFGLFGGGGSSGIALAADQCTLFYTPSASPGIKRFNVCTNTQLPDFATSLHSDFCWAPRIRFNGEVLVACDAGDPAKVDVYRLDATGRVMQTYPASNVGDDRFDALDLDPAGTSFWVGGYYTGKVYEIDIATGQNVRSFQVNPFGVGGFGAYSIAVFGGVSAGGPTPTPAPTCTSAVTATETPTSISSPTSTATLTNTPTATNTSTNTPTPTSTPTNTETPPPSSTNTPSATMTATPTETPTNVPTATPTQRPPNTVTATPTSTPTDTVTNTAVPPTTTRTLTNTPTATATATNTPLPPTVTNTPTNTPVLATATPTNTTTATATSTPTDTSTATNTATATNTPIPPTNTPTDTPTETATNTPTATPTLTPLPPTDTPTTTPTSTPAEATLTYTGATSAGYDDPAPLAARLRDATSGLAVPGAPLTFSLLDPHANIVQTCGGTTDAGGLATCTMTPTVTTGSYTVLAAFSGDSAHQAVSTLSPFTVTAEETSLTYVGDTMGDSRHVATLQAVLGEDSSGPLLPGAAITFTLGSQGCTGTTDGSGLASCTLVPVAAAGSYTVTVRFGGDSHYQASSGSSPFTVLPLPTNTPTATATDTPTSTPTDTPTATDTPTNTPTATNTPTITPTVTNTPLPPTATTTPSASPSSTPTATATATPTMTPTGTAAPTSSVTPTRTLAPTSTATSTPIPPSATATTTNTPLPPSATATPSPTATPTQTLTPAATATAMPTSTATPSPTATATPVPYLAAGSFVLGDQSVAAALTATTPLTLTWWGAQWAKDNSLSGRAAPAAFKGFAQSLSTEPPRCGGAWTTGPGNSPAPPQSVPTYMAVIVASTITRDEDEGDGHVRTTSAVQAHTAWNRRDDDDDQEEIRGNVVAIVVVKTGPGYAPDPGHAGTGMIVQVVCGHLGPPGSRADPRAHPLRHTSRPRHNPPGLTPAR